MMEIDIESTCTVCGAIGKGVLTLEHEPKNEEFIANAWANSSPNIGFSEFLALFRAVERAHGIKGDA